MKAIAIYTDLDGSLLDHHSYSHAAADALLEELEDRNIPVIPATSKTRAELLPLRDELRNAHPFIVENGAAVLIPSGYFPQQPAGTTEQDGYWIMVFSRPRSHWLMMLDSLVAEFDGEFLSFNDMADDTIMSLTGLDRTAARRAAAREFGEPVHWSGSEMRRARFVAALQAQGARVLQGGRFLHVSDDCDKGRALRWLNDQYGIRNAGKPPLSIALGDSQNDQAMLEAADYALIIRSPAHEPPSLTRSGNTLLSTAYGPQGWDELVRRLLHTLTTQPDS